ncbi:MAG: asparagine synthase (glutamine-hydrolyzing) [Anaerolineaceae bacterium]|nr:asparagine synthase (glutamine-hydrolyzing) [Anaerolineaceae bacterium]
MCGINGIVRLSPDAAPVDAEELLRTRDAMFNRGPDSAGIWLNDASDIGLGHRRLAIIDLSPAGAQPMSWQDDRYHIVFNGEIYNYAALRDELLQKGVTFRSSSDTEVILALYALEGRAMLKRLRGMFTFAIWDEAEKTLLLARDPYGIKPLYYAQDGRHLRFASQVKALQAANTLSTTLSDAGLVGFLLWGSIPEPHTLWREIQSLPAGHSLLIENGQVHSPEAFYDPKAVLSQTEHIETGDILAHIANAIDESVEHHLVADVPVAIFLSSGLDSCMIAASATRQLPKPPVTFTVTFDDLVGTPEDEGPLAAQVAKTLDTEHIETRITHQDIQDLWSRVTSAMDQPSIDGFNTFVITEIVRKNGFKVVLSGLGGDELFGGYKSFQRVPEMMHFAQMGRMVPGLQTLLQATMPRLRPNQPKLAHLLAGNSLSGAYYLRRGLFMPHEVRAILGKSQAKAGFSESDPVQYGKGVLDAAQNGHALDPWMQVHVLESKLYMGNRLLRDSDWASMAHSVELRVPLVDATLRTQMAQVGFGRSLNLTKPMIARKSAPELPEAIFNKPKTGFYIPVMESTQRGSIHTKGLNSRKMAFEVLKSFGVDLQQPVGISI